MKIQKIKINGMVCPVGYVFDSVRVAWQVCGSRGVHTKYAKVEIAKDADFIKIISVKAGVLNSACTVMDIKPEARTRYFVRVSVTADNDETAVSTEAAYFETGKIDEEWQAKWLTTQEHDTFHPIFLRDFSSEKYVKQARLYISGLGLYEASLNGKRIGEERLTPYFSNYHQEVQYQTYDVTELIERENELRVSLGNGWYKGRFGLGGGPVNNYGSRFMMIAELHLTCEDGTEKVIASDESWSYIGSDFEETDIYDGEILNRLLWDGKENTQKRSCRGTGEREACSTLFHTCIGNGGHAGKGDDPYARRRDGAGFRAEFRGLCGIPCKPAKGNQNCFRFWRSSAKRQFL